MFKSANFDLSVELEVKVDLGYQGIQYLHLRVELLQKSSKKNPLTKQQKEKNAQKASK